MFDQVLVARLGDTEIARASERDTITIEGSVYFPPDSVNFELLKDSGTRTQCPWRGEAVYYDVTAGDRVVESAAWSYPRPTRKAARLRDFVSFWKEVVVEPV
ncbi:MAG: DUF427 domain-containing protein [Nisaea sp.]|jgi:uncharacterized protein (DUF427 family)|uniref:DUF427 domain-containing protein n=1 Tax=Nisaea sp. TaxID=2024842 RepID=UPI001B14B59A|nr:DUF427 domain-containing protein [Nisaea sp.]MBO6561676.1 DUF427 domain-containing protein [Nisaea sp.]